MIFLKLPPSPVFREALADEPVEFLATHYLTRMRGGVVSSRGRRSTVCSSQEGRGPGSGGTVAVIEMSNAFVGTTERDSRHQGGREVGADLSETYTGPSN